MYLALASLIILGLFQSMSNIPTRVISSSCSISYCGNSRHDPDIRFPFKVKGLNQPSSCGYSGFDVWCDQGYERTVMELPSSGNFSVKSIDYVAQEIWVNDLSNCLPKKLLSLNLSNSPFTMVYYQEFSFFNCSSILVENNNTNNLNVPIIGPIICLSGLDYFVYAIPFDINTSTVFPPPKCYMLAQMVKVPVQLPPLLDNKTGLSSILKLNEDLRLSWFMPVCQSCELRGQMCAVRSNSSGFEVIICENTTNQGKPRKMSLTTMVAVILVICSPSIICVVGSLYIWIRAYARRSPAQTSLELGPIPIVMNTAWSRQTVGLGQTDESGPEYIPDVVLSEIEDLEPVVLIEGENLCAICMVEYHTKDKLGTLPICGHYFHATCINQWLVSCVVLEPTCPICRARIGS